MGAKGRLYVRRKQARRNAKFEKVVANIRTALRSPKLRDACEWVDAHPGEDPEFEKEVKDILKGLNGLNHKLRAADRAYDKRRKRFKVVK